MCVCVCVCVCLCVHVCVCVSPSHHGHTSPPHLVTVDTPSTNLVLKRTFALLNIPSFNNELRTAKMTPQHLTDILYTIGTERVKESLGRPDSDDVLIECTCVWERSSAASTSSRMYTGAGLNSSRDRMRERARIDYTCIL